jgi:Concanavalin A-like lectin/glucanases superfamily
MNTFFIKISAFITASAQLNKNWVLRLTICLVLATALLVPQACKDHLAPCTCGGPTQDLVVCLPFTGSVSNQACGVNMPANSLIVSNLIPTTDRNNVANSAYQFNGTNSLLYIDNVSYGTNVTLSCWVKPDKLNQNAVFLYYGNPAQDGYGLLMSNGQCNVGNNQAVLLGGVNCDLMGSSQSFLNTDWSYLTLVKQDNTFMLYVNGVLKITRTGQANQPAGRITIGGHNFPTTYNGYYAGKIDEVRVYNRALSSSEVATLYAL